MPAPRKSRGLRGTVVEGAEAEGKTRISPSLAPPVRGFRFHRCARRVQGKSRCVTLSDLCPLLVPTPPRDTGNRTSQHRGGGAAGGPARARALRTCIYFSWRPDFHHSHPYLIWRRSQLGQRWTGPGPPKPCPKRGRRGPFRSTTFRVSQSSPQVGDRTYPTDARTQKYTARSISWSWHANVIYIHAFRGDARIKPRLRSPYRYAAVRFGLRKIPPL